MSNDQELREGRLVFYRNDLGRIDRVLEEFLRLSGSSSVILVDKEGHMITRAGKAPSFDQDTISALVAGSFSATRANPGDSSSTRGRIEPVYGTLVPSIQENPEAPPGRPDHRFQRARISSGFRASPGRPLSPRR